MKKNILIVNTYYVADTGGGACAVLLEHAKFFRNHGYNVDILTGYIDRERIGEFKKFNLISVNVGTELFLPIRHILFILRYLFIKLKDYDQIWVHDFPSTILALRSKKVHFLCYGPNGLLYLRTRHFLNKTKPYLRPLTRLYIFLMKKLDKFLIKKINLIVVISKSVKEKVREYYRIENAIVAYPGIYFEEHHDIQFQRFIYTPSRLVPQKRVDLIVKAMKYLPDYELYISGIGEEEEKLKDIAKEDNLRVNFFGFLPVEKRDELYSKCFCVIYIPENEDFGMVPIEAQSYGKMVIGANEGGEKETIIHGKTGFLLDNITPENIAKCVREIEKIDPKTRVNECIENAKRFDWKNFHKKFGEVVKVEDEL